ncbi:VWA domain-containing protein [Silvibacterium acidisoli]|uniref:VWA domain-containing protein n=1 Tax=Acidobacteriaceae bacterium ZG23-2 TaxID=2883246 RepID=UPI00406CA348
MQTHLLLPCRPRYRALFLCALLLPATTPYAGAQSAEPSGVTTIRTEAQLVTVDVSVHDRDGRPVHNLTRNDFLVTENNQQQTIRNFEESTFQNLASSRPKLPPMPPGTFSDYTPVAPSGPLNVLLLDSLNTSMADQSYVRYELQQYVKKAKPGTAVAIFGLSQRLYMLQGFNSDPEVLKDAVEHHLKLRASSLLDDALGSGSNPDEPSDMAAQALSNIQETSGLPIASVISNMQQFESDEKAESIQMRSQYTLDAFNALAHYLSNFPGRKNLIWFSGSFPLNILLDPTLKSGAIGLDNDKSEFQETSSLLSKAQVAVYPMDARGLSATPTFSAANRKGDPQGERTGNALMAQASEHATMSQLADDTGGKPFYDTNDLATSVQEAIDSGSNYYTLTYAPSNHRGGFRTIRVELSGKLAAAGYSLEYRHGYFVDNRTGGSSQPQGTAHMLDEDAPVSEDARYVRLAMAHGAPAPQDVLFKVRVIPASSQPEETLAANNVQPADHPLHPPFRRFVVDIVAVPGDFQLALSNDGHRTGSLEFSVLLYNNDGKLLNTTGKLVSLDLTPDRYRQFMTGVNGHFEISLPAKDNDLFLRIGVHDIPSNKMGVVEVPVSSVAKLAPASH